MVVWAIRAVAVRLNESTPAGTVMIVRMPMAGMATPAVAGEAGWDTGTLARQLAGTTYGGSAVPPCRNTIVMATHWAQKDVLATPAMTWISRIVP